MIPFLGGKPHILVDPIQVDCIKTFFDRWQHHSTGCAKDAESWNLLRQWTLSVPAFAVFDSRGDVINFSVDVIQMWST